MKKMVLLTIVTAILAASCFTEQLFAEDVSNENHALATFAGGCFWCMEPPYDKLKGVLATTSGYAGGDIANPTYEQVSSGATNHVEVVQVEYDPKVISYEKLLETYWHNIDPFDSGGQFCDRGRQYRTAIFYHSDHQRKLAEQSRNSLAESRNFSGEIVTDIVLVLNFYPAEDYHQNYYQKNPIRYKFYRYTCGRDERLEDLWKPK